MAHREEERGTAAGRLGPAVARHPPRPVTIRFLWTGSDQDRAEARAMVKEYEQGIPVKSMSWCVRTVDSTGYQDLITGSHGR
jgi:hypothetical protein